MEKKLKHHFLDAVIDGRLGKQTEYGVVVTTKEFTAYFTKQNKEDYLRSYLPSVAIECGRHMMQHNKYVFKIGHGVYRIHNEAVLKHLYKHGKNKLQKSVDMV